MIEVEELRFRRAAGGFELCIEELALERGERLALLGPSGSGKSTLLALAAGILRPDSGRMRVLGHELGALPEPERRRLRLERMGLVFQELELLDQLSLLDNALLPLHLAGHGRPTALDRGRARELLASVGLDPRERRAPSALSRGERQRLALARALVNEPELLLCDEPTASLDARGARELLALLLERARASDATLLFATHDPSLLSAFERHLDLGTLPSAARR